MSRTASAAGAPASARFGSARLTPAEVKQLWWLLDGGIMHAGFREQLRRSWGLCPRHAWAYALVEVELRGGLPFATSVLVEDLLLTGGDRRLVGRLHSERRQLAGSGRCATCEYLLGDPDVEPSWQEAAERASGRDRMGGLIGTHASQLRRWACPQCLGGRGLVCRPHIVSGAAAPPNRGDELADLAARVRAWRRATEPGERREADERSTIAWAEGLGWLAGWDPIAAWARR
jgi:hypothetical protein